MFLVPQFRITTFCTTTPAGYQIFTDPVIAAYPSFANYNSLIINADTVSTGTQNSTFIDSSNNNHIITSAGAIQTSKSPYHPNGWSISFDGSTDCLTVPANSVFDFGAGDSSGSGDFTMECWVNTTVFSLNGSYVRRILGFALGDVVNNLQLVLCRAGAPSSKLGLYTTGQLIDGDIEVADGQWHHIALSRIGTNMRLFVDGQQSGDTLVNNTASYSAGVSLVIGRYGMPVNNVYYGWFNGYISNLRIIKGQGLYSGTFFPSTGPLTKTTVGATGGGAASSITGTVSLLALQNSRLIDNSSSAHAFTRVGTPQIDCISPFMAATNYSSSLYCDGSTQWVTVPANTDFNFGAGVAGNTSGDFTIEFWVNTDQFSPNNGFRRLLSFGPNAATNLQLAFLQSSVASSKLGIYTNDGNSFCLLNGTIPVATGTWHHIAVSRNGTNLKLFVDGEVSGATTNTTNFNAGGSNALSIGTQNNSLAGAAQGYISNLRIVKGQCLYTGSFTPPQAELTKTSTGTTGANVVALNSAKVVVLTLQGNELVDNSSSPKLVTSSTAAPSFSRNTPFFTEMTGLNRSYAGHFSRGARVLAPAGSDFAYGTNPFTIEFWVRPDSVLVNSYDSVIYSQATNGRNYFVIMLTKAGRQLTFISAPSDVASAPGNTLTITSTTAIPLNTWSHIAVVREGTGTNQTKIYINGVLNASGTCTRDFTDTAFRPSIGTYTHAATINVSDFCGAVSNFRIVKGQALYTGNFTPAVSPLTKTTVGATGYGNPSSVPNSSITGTVSLLTLQDATFKDNGSNSNTLTLATGTGGDIAYIRPANPTFPSYRNSAAAPVPYDPALHGGSIYFNGSTDYLSIPNNAAFDFSNGDFTIEAWIYTADTQFMIVGGDSTATNQHQLGFGYNIDNGAQGLWLGRVGGGVDATSGVQLVYNTWNHVAVTKSSGSVKFFVNGLQSGSTAPSTVTYTQRGLYVGRDQSTTAAWYYSGYISDLRIVKGQALYVSNFIPPANPLPNTTDTSLLLRGNNGAIIDAAGKNTVVLVGNAAASSVVPHFESKTLSFDGNGDYLTCAQNTIFEFGLDDFTVEFWVNFNAVGNYLQQLIFYGDPTSTTSAQIAFGCALLDAEIIQFSVHSSGTQYAAQGTTTIAANTWYHIAITREGGTLKMYLNGNFENSAAAAVTINTPTGRNLYISRYSTSSSPTLLRYVNGYMDDIRITKGVARYRGASFAVPTRALNSV